jgi:hypothetical protein
MLKMVCPLVILCYILKTALNPLFFGRKTIVKKVRRGISYQKSDEGIFIEQ